MLGCASRAEQPAFASEAVREPRLHDAAVEKLQRDLAVEPAVATRGQPHFSHTATADQSLDRVGPDGLTGQ